MAHKIPLNLDIFSDEPLEQQLYYEVRAAIHSGKVRAGNRLPPLMEFSRQLQVGASTVRDAIERLLANGLIVSKRGAGNFVSESVMQEKLPPSGDPDDIDVQFTQANEKLGFVEFEGSIPWSNEALRLAQTFNESAFHPWWELPVDYDFRVHQQIKDQVNGLHWNEVAGRWARRKSLRRRSTENIDPRGMPELRREISAWLNRTRHLECMPDDVFITSGAQQARDFVARLLVDPNRGVVVEDPYSLTDLLAYELRGADLIHIRTDNDGIDTRELDRIKSAAAAHLITTANYPTGATLSLERRERVLEWAVRCNATIVEDSFGAGYQYAPVVPSLYEMARKHPRSPRVVYIGSLSHFVNPALRIGFAVLPKIFQDSFVATEWLTERHPSLMPQELALLLFSEGVFLDDSHRLQQAARLRRRALLAALECWPQELVAFEPVKAGFQQAVWLKESMDDLLVFERALAQKIGVIPLSPFFSENPKPGLSLGFVQMNEENIKVGMGKLLKVIEDCHR